MSLKDFQRPSSPDSDPLLLYVRSRALRIFAVPAVLAFFMFDEWFTGPARPGPAKSYYSPVDEAALAKDPSVKISQKIDHMEISYSLPCKVKNCISEVWENRWEDGSGFQVLDGQAQIMRLDQASPYWGYRQQNTTSLFFVDYPLQHPGIDAAKLKYSQFAYGYILLERSETGSRIYNCTLNFVRTEGHVPSALANRQVGTYSFFDPILLPISKFLAEHGADLTLDKCKARSAGN